MTREEKDKLFSPLFKGPEALPSFRSQHHWSPALQSGRDRSFPWRGWKEQAQAVLELVVISLRVTLPFVSLLVTLDTPEVFF